MPSDRRSFACSRDSTLMTLAPMSASSMVQKGMAITWPRSSTVTSLKACSIRVPSLYAERCALLCHNYLDAAMEKTALDQGSHIVGECLREVSDALSNLSYNTLHAIDQM